MDQTPIISLAAGHPLIDVDATVIVQFVLFLVLFVIANRFLFQPYLRLRERRTEGIEGARGDLDGTRGDRWLRARAARDAAPVALCAAHCRSSVDKARASHR